MDQQQTLALWAQGKDAWNAWAEELLGRRKAMEAAGTWAATKDFFGSLEGQNDGTRAFLADAAAVFSTNDSKHTFEQDQDFSGRKFPGAAWFGGAAFSGDAWFVLAKFKGYTSFANATFVRGASFNAITGDTAFTFTGGWGRPRAG